MWLTLVQVYAPTDGSKDEGKERFYCDLQEIINKSGRKETLVVKGDLKSREGLCSLGKCHRQKW